MSGLDFEALGGSALEAPTTKPKGLNFQELGGQEIPAGAADPQKPAGLDFEALGGSPIDDAIKFAAKGPLALKAGIEKLEEAGSKVQQVGSEAISEIVREAPPSYLPEKIRNLIQLGKAGTLGSLDFIHEISPMTPTGLAQLALGEIGLGFLKEGVRGGSAANQAVEKFFPKLAKTLFKERPVLTPGARGQINFVMSQLKEAMGIPQEKGVAVYDFEKAFKEGRLSNDQVKKYDTQLAEMLGAGSHKDTPAAPVQEAAAPIRELGAPDPTLPRAAAEQVELVRKNYEPIREAYKAAAIKEVGSPRYLSSDLFKTMELDGREDFTPESSQTRRPAGREFIEHFKQDLMKDPEMKDNPIMVMAGITGAGKTTSLRSLGQLDRKSAENYALILDTNFADFNTAKKTIEEFLASSPNREIRINYVERDPVKAYTEGVIPRSLTEKRVVPVEEHLGYIGAKDSIIKLQEAFKDNPRVAFKFFENNGAKGEAKPISLEALKKIKYNEAEVRRALYEHIQREETAGRLGPAQSQLLRGNAQQSPLRSDGPGDVPGQQGQSTQEVTPDEPESFSAPTQQATPTRIPVAPISGVAPKSLSNIVFDVSKAVGRKVFYGQPSRRAGGTYYPGTAATVVKYSGDLDTTAHELAHSLDDKFDILTPMNQPGILSAFDEELAQFWPFGSVQQSGPKAAIGYKRAEGVAEFIRAWIVNPAAAEQAAPKFAAYLKFKLPDSVIKSLKSFSNDVRSFAGASAHEKIMANVRWTPPDDSFLRSIAGGNIGPGFSLTWADRLKAHLQDDLAAFTKAVDYARGEKGMTQLLPSSDPVVLARLYSGIHAKMDDIFEKGMVDIQNARVTPGGVKWLFETLDGSSPGGLEREIQEVASYMIAQRTVERTEKPLAESISKVNKSATARLMQLKADSDAAIKKVNEILNKRKAGLDTEHQRKIQELKENTQKRIRQLEKMYAKRYREMLETGKGGPVGREQLRELAAIEKVYDRHKKAIKALGQKLEAELQNIQGLRNKQGINIRSRFGKASSELQLGAANTKRKLTEYFRSRRISGVGGGIDRDYDVSLKRVSELEASPRFKNIAEAANRYRMWSDAVLRYIKNKGRISEEQYQGIKKENEHYVAMQRVMETAPGEEMVMTQRSASRLGSSAQPIKTFKGSSRSIENPYTSLMESTYKAIREADRNEVMAVFRDMLNSDRGMGMGPVQDLASVGRKAASTDRNTIPIFVKGKREDWQFQEDVYKAIKGIVDGHYMVPGFITFLPRLLRSTIVNMPPFALRNFIRDAQQRAVVSEVGSGLTESLRRRGPMDISNLKLFGGDQAGHYLRDRVDYSRAMETAVKELSKDKRNIVVSWEKLKNGYSDLIQSGEIRGRMAEYAPAFRYAKRVLKYDDYNAGLYAASKARGLLDFAVAGSLVRFINQLVPFVNAGVQGLQVSLKAAQRNPRAFTLRWMLYIAIPTLMERAYNKIHNDKEYQQLPAYIRDMFYNFKLGPDTWLRIPKPFEIGVMASGLSRAVDAASGEKHAGEGYMNSVTSSIFPVDDISLAGPYQGVIQTIANYDFFRNRAIVPRHEEKLDLDLRNTSNASRIGQWLQRGVGMDARKIDFLMRQQLGNLGAFVLNASNVGRKDQPGITLRDTGLVVGSPAYAARDVQWVMKTAAGRGLTDRKDYKSLVSYLNAYWNAPNNEGKDIAARRLTDYATQLRSQWENSTILENKKLRKKVEKKAAAAGK